MLKQKLSYVSIYLFSQTGIAYIILTTGQFIRIHNTTVTPLSLIHIVTIVQVIDFLPWHPGGIVCSWKSNAHDFA